MLKTLAKGYAYSTHPRLTFAALHPEEAIQLAHMRYDLRHGWAPRLTAVVAAAVALPIGLWIGRRVERRVAARMAEASRPAEPRLREPMVRRPTRVGGARAWTAGPAAVSDYRQGWRRPD